MRAFFCVWIVALSSVVLAQNDSIANNKISASESVELLSFKAEINENTKLNLLWKTATEKNNTRFEIEKSIDEITWEFVCGIDGAGTTSLLKNYSCIDGHPFSQLSYYRLKMMDLDGSFKYSPIVSIDPGPSAKKGLDVYPNPTSDIITIQGSAAELETIFLYDLVGKEVDISLLIVVRTSVKIVLDLSTLKQGIYFLKSKSFATRIVKM